MTLSQRGKAPTEFDSEQRAFQAYRGEYSAQRLQSSQSFFLLPLLGVLSASAESFSFVDTVGIASGKICVSGVNFQT